MSKLVQVQIDDAVHALLVTQAESEDRSLVAHCRYVLKKYAAGELVNKSEAAIIAPKQPGRPKDDEATVKAKTELAKAKRPLSAKAQKDTNTLMTRNGHPLLGETPNAPVYGKITLGEYRRIRDELAAVHGRPYGEWHADMAAFGKEYMDCLIEAKVLPAVPVSGAQEVRDETLEEQKARNAVEDAAYRAREEAKLAAPTYYAIPDTEEIEAEFRELLGEDK